MEIIIQDIPNTDTTTIKFLKYFSRQWLNGNQSPEIWNHHETIERRTNNGLEGHHRKIDITIQNDHPQLFFMVVFCKNQNALTTDRYLETHILLKFKNRSKKLKKISEFFFYIKSLSWVKQPLQNIFHN